MTPRRAIIYDFDGPILDSFDIGLQRIRKILQRHGISWSDALEERIVRYWGRPGVTVLQKALKVNKKIARTLRDEWVAMDIDTFMPLVHGARKALDVFSSDSAIQTILTSRQTRDLFPNLEHYNLKHFSIFQTADSGYHKPDPRVFDWTLERLREQFNLGRESCVFVGDTLWDAEPGICAGVETLMVRTGPFERQMQYASREVKRYFKRKPENIIDSIERLPAWVATHRR